ncbi:MAG: hypothetical protein JXX14_15280 [Deltaproteobacteria bacterium]|nr:hypothetical protein [Deltaproteobacteria bacterium]
MSPQKKPNAPLLIDTLEDPQGFILSLIGAEVLATKREDGPLARPWRTGPHGHATATNADSATTGRTPRTKSEEGSRG